MKKRLPLAILVMAVLISLDQFVKYLIDSSFSVGESQPLIDNVFQLTYVQNRGAAWGSFSGKVVISPHNYNSDPYRIYICIYTAC